MLEQARQIAEKLLQAGARDCLMVGGYVRDRLMGIDSKDIDLEVYGLSYRQIVNALRDLRVDLVGKSFGILKIGPHIDVSIPRRERKQGAGHRAFAIEPDPDMTYREAASRRDFTINSIAMDFEGRIIDPYDGQGDIRRKLLRATSAAFKEDPLRVLRGMQFASRLGFEMAADTVQMCREISGEFADLSRERIYDEWAKWTRGDYPAKGLSLLQDTGWLDHFPALANMAGTPQDPVWHPEGDVWVHTALVCDAAAKIANRRGFSPEERLQLMFAALLHDAGKAVTTEKNEQGRWVSPGHAGEGVPIARRFLRALGAPGRIIDTVPPLVAEHMVHISLPADQEPGIRLIRRLANRLTPANIRLWAALCEADYSGRPPLPAGNPVAHWEEVAQQQEVENTRPGPLLLGRHLIDRGIAPGPEMGRLLKAAYEAQLDGAFDDLEGALAWLNQQ